MKYLLSIYMDESRMADVTPEEGQAVLEAYGAFTEEARSSGAFLAGEGLQPTATATAVRGEAGKPRVTDGPFAETKEQLGGFYLLECKDVDEAIEWAGKVPAVAAGGTVEVRPVMDYEAAESGASADTAAASA